MKQEIVTAIQQHADAFRVREGNDERVLLFAVSKSPMFNNPRVGGLADRLKGLLSVYALAIATNRRFLARWDTPVPLGHNLEPAAYDWTINSPLQGYLNKAVCTHHAHLIDNGEPWQLEAREFETSILSESRYCVINTNHLRFDPLLKLFDVVPSFGITCELAAVLYQSLFIHIELETFALQREAFEAFKASHDAVIGVHLRTGGGNGWNDPAWDKPSNAPVLVERARDLARRAGYQNPGFYFISDSAEAREIVAADRKPDVMVELEKVTHLDRSANQDTRDNDLAFHEFEMLRRCSSIISGKGGFAQMAAITANIPFCRYT